jgi:type IV pilus assembly protein PilB
VHIEPFEDYIKIRYRIDGQLNEIMRTDIDVMPAIAARIKIVSGMNIAEKRLPQDGRVSVEIDGEEFDLRVSTLPTVFGEKIVIRIADKKSFIISKDKLGFTEDEKDKFEKMLRNPHGIILVTGPTGSGKSTTLYSALNEINRPGINIVTVEDPVEALIEGINQVQVNYKTGLTFAVGLRSILRQDPNVVMIGEIRDAETAHIAVRAAITGHLVLSTLHTNNAPSSVIRLIDMGIEPYMVASSVVGVISQRLVRKICETCRQSYTAEPEQLSILGVNQTEEIKLYRGKGCPVCSGTGYLGRIGIFEIMPVTRQHRELIISRCSEQELADLSVKFGMRTLKDNARDLVLKGITTIDEMMNLSYSNE